MEIIISVFLLFVGIAILVIIHICIVGRAFRREFFGSDGLPIIKGAGLTVQDLKKLPCFEYTQQQQLQQLEDNKDEEDSCNDNTNNNQYYSTTAASMVECAVCLDPFKSGDNCRLLPSCHHFFHATCVDAWLMKSPFCPICRTCTTFVATMLSPKVGSADLDHQQATTITHHHHHHDVTSPPPNTTTNHVAVAVAVAADEMC